MTKVRLQTVLILVFALTLKYVQCCQAGQYDDSGICMPCPNSTFSPTGNRTSCESCHQCHFCDPVNGDCLSCQAGYQLDGIACIQCNQGTYSRGGTDICQSCDSNCYVCNKTNGICLSCNSGYAPNETSCAQCSPGSYSNGSSSCEACSEVCNTCSVTDGSCTSCRAGFELQNGVCSICPANYFNQNGEGQCKECLTCQNCQNTTGACTECSTGYGLSNKQCKKCSSEQYTNPQTYLCSSCNDACLTCSGPSSSECTSCQVSLGFINNTCTPCQKGTTSDGLHPCEVCKTQQCSSCTNDGICEACFTPYQLINASHVCGQPCSAPNCSLCTSDNICAQCQPNYTLKSEGYCIECSVLNCLACFQTNICQSCSNSFVPSTNNSSCVACSLPENCLSCSADNFCGQCIDGYGSVNGVCYICGVVNCAKCDNETINCQQCETNYTYSPSSKTCNQDCSIPNCFACESPNICKTCNINFTLDSENNICLRNCGIDNCISCSGSTCSACATNYILLGFVCNILCDIQNCIKCKSNAFDQCEQCSEGFSVSADGSSCVLCSVLNCYKCSFDGKCTECMGNLVPTGGKCFQCQVDNCKYCSEQNKCRSCVVGYYKNLSATGNHDQCIVCAYPCNNCYSNGNCKSCFLPYSQVTLPSGGFCFLCADPNCYACSDSNIGSCITCRTGQVNNGSCIKIMCSTGCVKCLNMSYCLRCEILNYYLTQNNTCQVCPNAPLCWDCSVPNPQICQSCSTGFYQLNNSCIDCPAYCDQCTSETWCSQLFNIVGYVLLSLSATVNVPALCDPGCSTCSTTNPEFCLICLNGYFLTTNNDCQPCQSSSYCASCSQLSPSVCLTCFSGYFLSTNSTCSKCTFPCLACVNQSSTMCSACPLGYVLLKENYSCLSVTHSIFSSFGSMIQNCVSSAVNQDGSMLQCLLCLPGFVLTPAGCAPCAQGCQICSTSLIECITCVAGYSLNNDNVCVQSGPNCINLASWGCNQCASNYILTRQFTCQLPCIAPCSTCDPSNPNMCFTCLEGYTLNIILGCVPSTDCNKDTSCLVCPYGYSLLINNSDVKINQTCIQCDIVSNCARCSLQNTSQCLSCGSGFYLSNKICVSCPLECANCISSDMCTECSPGYISQQSVLLTNNVSPTSLLLNCSACTDNCATCQGTSSTCTSCVPGFALTGITCISTFNFQIVTTLEVTLSVFVDNYVSYLNQIAKAANISMKNILIVSIVSEPVTITMQISSNFAAGSSAAISAEDNLKNLLAQGNTVANMQISSSSITTNGGSNDDKNDSRSEISHQEVIILATIIPILTVLFVGTIVIIYLLLKNQTAKDMLLSENKAKELLLDEDSKEVADRVIELSMHESKQAQF